MSRGGTPGKLRGTPAKERRGKKRSAQREEEDNFCKFSHTQGVELALMLSLENCERERCPRALRNLVALTGPVRGNHQRQEAPGAS